LSNNPSRNCLVSVVIPCRNEINYIEEVLRSIYENDYPSDLIEVIVVDGMSNDGTREIFPELENKYPQVSIIDNLDQKTPFAFNLGIKQAKGDIVMICGARFLLSKNYIREIVNVLNNQSEVGCVGGKIINVYENANSEIISKAMASKFGVGFNNFRTIDKDVYVDTVTPPAFRKSIFDELGYFDEDLTRNQDDDFSFRLIKAGYKILLKSNISFKYYVRASFNKLFKQYRQYGYWKVYVNKKHRTVTTLRQLFPVLFLLSFPLFTILTLMNIHFVYVFILEIGCYTLLSFIFAFQTNGCNFIHVFKQMYTCVILHFSYGLGYLEGILDFLILNKRPNKKNETLSR
jgi:cellulose synthase/poly-beta-1,6-N-acetylglucosamine synthase-like glycosyltransferase